MIQIYIDADACPVKNETYQVAERYKIKVYVVANTYLSTPMSGLVEMVQVPGKFDAADDWIAGRVTESDIVITSDILLAERCVKKQARVLRSNGEEFTEDNVGMAAANRELMQNLRHMGEMRGGPPPMDKKARSRFLGNLDRVIQSLKSQKKF